MDVIFENTQVMGDSVETDRVAFYDATPTVTANALLKAMNATTDPEVAASVRESIREDMR